MAQRRSKPIWPVIALLTLTVGVYQLHAFFGPNSVGAVLVIAVLCVGLVWFLWVGWIGPVVYSLIGTRQPS